MTSHIKAMTSQNRKLVDNRFQNTRTSQKESGILCRRLLGVLCVKCLTSRFECTKTQRANTSVIQIIKILTRRFYNTGPIHVTVEARTGPLACLSPFAVICWIRNLNFFSGILDFLIYVTDGMFWMNGTTSVPKSVLR